MKKLITGLTVITVLAFTIVVYAHGPGRSGEDYLCPGHGNGVHMMGPGYKGHMMGQAGGFDQKFLDESADLRRELHNKKFEYFEAKRNPETTYETVAKLEKDIHELQEKIHEKAQRRVYGKFGGYGCM